MPPEPIKQISLGGDHNVMLSTTGNVYTWGSNSHGQLGWGKQFYHREIQTSFKVTKVPLPGPIDSIATGANTTAAVTTDGRLFIWGEIKFHIDRFTPSHPAMDGGGAIDLALQPIEISIRRPISYVSIGFTFMIAVTRDGYLNYWGDYNLRPDATE